jgi:hypothetical protein
VKVGDLVKIKDHAITGVVVSLKGPSSRPIVNVLWANTGRCSSMGGKFLEVISESR